MPSASGGGDELWYRLMARAKRKRKARAERLHREPIVRRVAELLLTGEPTPWRWTSEARHGLRARMCLDGMAWHLADARAEEIVRLARHRIGLSRFPTWTEALGEAREEREYFFCCSCGGHMPEGSDRPWCSSNCRDVHFNRRSRSDRKDGELARRQAFHAIFSDGLPEQPKAIEARERLCRHCREPFTAKRASRFYCSNSCLSSARRLDIRDCLVCAEPFTAKIGQQKYCGPECRATAMRHAYKVQPREKSCAHCGEAFTTHRSTAIYCSKGCRDAAFRDRHAADIPERACGICEQAFTPFNPQALYCSDSCSDEGRRRTERVRLGRPATPAESCCTVCTTPFVGRLHAQLTCSDACRVEANRRRARAHHEAKKQRAAVASSEVVDLAEAA